MALALSHTAEGRAIGRYVVYDSIGSGGMASVHLGRYRARFGFSRTVAIKRLHDQYACQPEFVAMFVDEAHLASRINHPNVVSTLDVVFEQGEVLLVMEYVFGESLAALLREAADKQVHVPAPVVVGILGGALRGLHAAHVARAEDGSNLHIVHRDMSPQNIVVGVDGVAKVLDFGVAKAAMRSQISTQGQIKGKFAYMAPEQLMNRGVDARTDVFACGVVLWECLTLRRLFSGDDLGETIGRMLNSRIAPPSQINRDVPAELDAVVLRALEREPGARYQSAAEFADALETAMKSARTVEVGQWVESVADASLSARARLLADIEANRHTAAVASRPPTLESATPSSTVSTVVVLQKPPRRKRLLVGSLLLGGLAMAVGVFAWPTKGDAVGPREGSLPLPESSALSQPAPVASPTAEASPPAPSGVASATPNPSASLPKKPIAATKTPAPSRPSCNPPYWVDKSGVRRVRLECLK